MNLKRTIAWRKWVDPTDDIDEANKKIEEHRKENALHSYDEDLDSDKEMKSPKGFRILSSAFGLIPLTENNLPSNNFDFWIGYTNFDLTNEVVEVLNNIPGIEILDVFSRYTFKIGIGRHPDFTFRKVRQWINEALCKEQHDVEDEILEKMNMLQEKLKSSAAWAILALPNGCIQSISTDNAEDPSYAQKLSTYKDLTLGVGAILATSEDKSMFGG
jgi:hypothetical protein